MTRARAGFTLIEVVGAFFMTIVILIFVTGIFVENGRQRDAATELMRERLSAVAALDLLSSDLEAAVYLARPEGRDPEEHPWRFLADDAGDLGATAFRFVTQNASSSNRALHASSWIEVAYFLEDDEDGERVLWRWASPRPPSEPNREFPDSGSTGSMRVVLGVADFGVRFLDADGSWVSDWDSTFYPPDQAMPLAAEISLTLERKARPGEEVDADHEAEPRVAGFEHRRRVALVMRPLDVDALIKLAEGDADEEACFTIDRCLSVGDTSWYEEELDDDCGGDERLCDLLENPSDSCWSEIETSYPDVASRAPGECSS